MNYFLIFACLTCITFTNAERISYEGYQVWTIYPQTQGHLDFLYSIKDEVDISVTKILTLPVQMMVAPQDVSKYRELLTDIGIVIDIDTDNIQKNLEETYARIDAKLAYDPNDYNTVDEIHSEMDRLAGICAAGITCEIVDIGQSVEGRAMKMFRMTKEGDNRKGHYVDSLIHAREWLAGATVMRILDHLVTGYGSDGNVTNLVDTYDFYFVPVVNPDGYQYTFDTDRMWRKSRNPIDRSICYGTDLNRNFEFEWGRVGSSRFPCDCTYRGSGPASEPEIQAIQNAAQDIASSLISSLSVHTTAYVWLSPYGYARTYFSCNRPDDHEDIHQVGEAAVAAIENYSGDNWEAGTACELLYEANGVTVDYMYSIGVKYSYTPELRGPGFDPPPTAIQPSFEEIWVGYLAMIAEIESIEAL